MPEEDALEEQTRQFVLRLRDYFEQEKQNGGPLIPVSQVRERVAAALGISTATVSRISIETYGTSGLESNIPSTPNKKRRPCRITEVDYFDADAIRRHVYDYYLRKEIPTLKKLTTSLRDSGLFRGQKTSLAKVLKRIGFSYEKSDKQKILTERTRDIALAELNSLIEANNK